jgi:hypothetical protein
MASLLDTRAAKIEAYRARIAQEVPGMPAEEVLEWCDTFFSIGVSLAAVPEHLADTARRFRERAQFDQGLVALGFQVHAIEGRGDCLFGAVAHQVYGVEALHPLVRAVCVAFLRALHAHDAAPDAGLESYLCTMAKPRTWGDEVCAKALSDIYGRPLRVWIAGFAAPRVHPDFPGAQGEGQAAPLLELANYSGVTHFDSLVTAGTLAHRLDPQRAGEVEALAVQRLVEAGEQLQQQRAAAAAAAAGAAAAVAGEAGAGAAAMVAPAAASPCPAVALAVAETAACAAADGGGGGSSSDSMAAAAPPSPASSPGGLLAQPRMPLAHHVQHSLMRSLSRAQRCHERHCSLSEGGGGSSSARVEEPGPHGASSSSSSSKSEGGQGITQHLTFPS